MSSISESWGRIHIWLKQHAPKILASLNPGASISELDAAEKLIGGPLPTELRELYSIHDGQSDEINSGSLFHGMSFLNLTRMLDEVADCRDYATEGDAEAIENVDVVENADVGIKTNNMYCGRWLPIAHDWGELLLKVDLAPEPTGKFGQVIFTDYTYSVVGLVSPSINCFLSDFADDLEGGRYFLNENSFEKGHEFLDCDGDIDVVNWWESPRWKHLQT